MCTVWDLLWRAGGNLIGAGWTLRDWALRIREYDERYSYGGSAWVGYSWGSR